MKFDIRQFVFSTTIIFFLLLSLCHSLSSPPRPSKNVKTRRDIISQFIQSNSISGGILLLSTINNPSMANASTAKQLTIEDRLTTNFLTLPPPSRASELNGIDNVYYPSWLAGEWEVIQTMTDTSTPLGLKFVGGPNGSETIASESIKEQRKQLNVPVSLRLRYLKTKFGVAEDRLFNTKERLNAFAGRNVVASVEYADVGGSNRQSVLMMGGDQDTPLQTTGKIYINYSFSKSFMHQN